MVLAKAPAQGCRALADWCAGNLGRPRVLGWISYPVHTSAGRGGVRSKTGCCVRGRGCGRVLRAESSWIGSRLRRLCYL